MSTPTTVEWLENILRVAKTLPEEVHLSLWQECGTPRCLWGHCCVDPFFENLGFKLFGAEDWGYQGKISATPGKHLNIPEKDIDWMFMPYCYEEAMMSLKGVEDFYDLNKNWDDEIPKYLVIQHVEEILTKYQEKATWTDQQQLNG